MNDETLIETGTALVPFKATPIACLTDSQKMDALLRALTAEVDEFLKSPPDPATPDGRERIRSFAYQEIVKRRTALEKAALDLTEDWRTKTKSVNAERNRAVKELEALEAKVMALREAWEKAEKRRIDGIRYRIQNAFSAPFDGGTAAAWRSWIDELIDVQIDDSWQEYKADAAMAKDRALSLARQGLKMEEAREAQAAAEKIREAEAEREAEANAAYFAARLEAEQEDERRTQVKWIAENAQRLEVEAYARCRALAEIEDAARFAAAQRAIEAAAAAEARRLDQERLAAEARQRAAEAAVEAERARVKKLRDDEAREIATRVADKQRRAEVRRQIIEDLVGALWSDLPASLEPEDFAGMIADALIARMIRNVEVIF